MHGTQKRPTRPARAPAKNEPAVTPRRHVAPRLTTVELVERLVSLQLRQAPLDVLAAEALPPFLDMFDAPAGALLLYHCEDEALVLAAARGLSPAGTRHLGRLQRGAPEAWEIPLHGLLNRKAYIIERPDEHPFVPELVSREEIPRVANLASIPLYRGAMPIGIVLAIADRRPVSDTEILAHVLAFDVLALALDAAMPRRVQAVARAATPPTAALDADSALVCEPWVDPRDLARELEAKLATVRGERQSLAERLAATDTALADATAALGAARADRARAVAGAEAALEQAVGGRDAAIAEARAQRDAAVAEACAERDATVARLRSEHDAALEVARSGHAAVVEETRAARATAVAEARAEVQVAADAVVLGLRAEIAERNASLVEHAATLAERERTLATTTGERDQARGATAATSALVRQLRDEIAGVENALSGARSEREQERERATAHAEEILALRGELQQVRAEATQLAADRRRVLAALDDSSAEPAAVIEALRAQVARLEAQVETLETSRAELATRAATATDDAEHRVAMQRRALDELRAEHVAALAAVRADADGRLEETQRAHAEQLAAAVATAEGARGADEAAHRRVVEELRASATELRAAAAAQVAAVRAESEHQLTELRASSERALAEARATAERTLADERTGFERAVAEARARAERIVVELQAQDADERIRAERTVTELRAQYEDARAREQSETATLRARDAQALAAALATGDERAAEVERLAGSLAAVTVERDDLETRLLAALAAHEEVASTASARDHTTKQRLAEAVTAERIRVEREAAATRAAREREVAAERAAHQERLLAERALFEQQGANERTRFEAELAATVRTRDEHAARAAALAEENLQNGEALSAARRRQQALEDELAMVRAEAVRLREDRERVVAAVEDPAAEPATVIVTLRQAVASREAEVTSLAAERAELLRRVATESEVAEQHRVTHERERAAAEERITTQRRELEDAQHELTRGRDELEQRRRESVRLREELAEARAARAAAVAELGAVSGDRERMIAELDTVATERERALVEGATIATEFERTLTERESETMEREQALLDREIAAAARERALMDGERALAERERLLSEQQRARVERNGTGEPPAGEAFKLDLFQPISREEREAARFDPVPAAPALTVDVLVPGAHRVLDVDLERRTKITAALATVHGTARRVVFANVLAPSPVSMAEIESASASGALVIGYAADRERSRIVGALRCFAAPPSGADAAAALDVLGRQPRRLISLSEDIDAFIAAKAGLAAAGHSVAMACDAKQALDLLGMLTPDAVLVDARTAPEAAADFLAALEPEKGRVLVLLVHGSAAGGALATVVQRLLRPGALDPKELARVYEAIVTGPAPAPAKNGSVKAVRTVERPKTAPRKGVARRVVPQRR